MCTVVELVHSVMEHGFCVHKRFSAKRNVESSSTVRRCYFCENKVEGGNARQWIVITCLVCQFSQERHLCGDCVRKYDLVTDPGEVRNTHAFYSTARQFLDNYKRDKRCSNCTNGYILCSHKLINSHYYCGHGKTTRHD